MSIDCEHSSVGGPHRTAPYAMTREAADKTNPSQAGTTAQLCAAEIPEPVVLEPPVELAPGAVLVPVPPPVAKALAPLFVPVAVEFPATAGRVELAAIVPLPLAATGVGRRGGQRLRSRLVVKRGRAYRQGGP